MIFPIYNIMSNSTPDEILSKKLVFEPFINYESIVCTHFPAATDKINAACIGIHFTTTKEVYIHAYEDTHTRKILKPGVKFAINFSENFYEYTVAALRRKNHDNPVDEIPKEAFLQTIPAPILKSAWAAVLCEVIEMPTEFISKPICRRRENPNIRAKIIETQVFHLPRIFNNRSWNLALEALILATRIPLYQPYTSAYKDAIKTYVIIKQKITQWRDMIRFEEAFDLMDNFLIEGGVKPQEISTLL